MPAPAGIAHIAASDLDVGETTGCLNYQNLKPFSGKVLRSFFRFKP